MTMKEKHIQRWEALYNDQLNVRLQKRSKMEDENRNPYKNGFKPSVEAKFLQQKYGPLSKDEIQKEGAGQVYKLAGRAMLVRDFGKAAFVQVDDGTDKFQVYVKKGIVSDNGFEEFKFLDYGDIVFASGEVFKTDKGELSLKAQDFIILTKALRPLPEKFHGLADPELKYRMRYVDMIMDPDVRESLKKRSDIIHYIRGYFYRKNYLEVETPMLHSIAGGATARPFTTHHNALSMDMYLRVAPELHLKRLIVGGYPKVFEMNRCFRNEGLSLKHNPEFTTIEFYEAYATYEDLMSLTEELVSGLARDVLQTDSITFGQKEISFARPFKRMSMRQAVSQYAGLSLEETYNKEAMIKLLLQKEFPLEKLRTYTADGLMVLCFDEFAEHHLIQPTFITEFPTEISPLSRRNDENPEIVDRFELFINGWEIANAFSELNNPTDQLQRFAEQAVKKESGDVEACDVDYDYVRALEYGMPPTAGEGIGIDRLCMILTNSPTIRDVILFPQLKKENFFHEDTSLLPPP